MELVDILAPVVFGHERCYHVLSDGILKTEMEIAHVEIPMTNYLLHLPIPDLKDSSSTHLLDTTRPGAAGCLSGARDEAVAHQD